MNYSLVIQLEGADEAEKSIDSLLKKVGGISSAPKISFSDWLDLGNEPEKAGEEIGDKITKGATSKLKSFNILDAWGKAKLKGLKDFWNNAIKVGAEGNSVTPPKMKGTMGQNLAKVQGLPDINSFAQSAEFKKILLGIGTGIMNPWIGSRILSDELSKGKEGGGVAAGIFGKGGAVGFTEFYLIFKAAKIAVDLFISALKIGTEWIKRAISNAAELYGRALSMGLSTKLLAQRSMTASVLGIPEDQVMRFKQSTYVMQRLAGAINEISKDAPALALVSAEFKITEFEALALASKIATKLSPALEGFAIVIDDLIKILSSDRMGSILAFLSRGISNTIIGPIGTEIGSEILDILSGIGKSHLATSNFNQPLTMMKQLPASSWEKMGLVTMGGTQNYAKETATNTRATVTAINKLAKYISKPSGGTKPTWGMSANTAQP